MLVQDQILTFLKATGPTVPTRVAKNLKTEIYLASAHLSDLAGQGKVKISNLKVGGSPLYYLPGQEEQLFPFAAGNVKPKDLIVLEKLRSRKVLREGSLELLAKVALRSLKDFAVPLNVNFKGKTELFWKWRLLDSAEANLIIRTILNPPKVIEKPIEKQTQIPTPEVKPEKIPQPPPIQAEVEIKKGPEPQAPEVKAEVKIKKTPETKKARKKVKKDDFFPILEKFFIQLNIEVVDKETVRSGSEINFQLKVPSVVGRMTYYGKAKSKGKCDEKDISTAYMEAQIKKLPLLFLYTGEVTKKAREMLSSDAFQNVITKLVE